MLSLLSLPAVEHQDSTFAPSSHSVQNQISLGPQAAWPTEPTSQWRAVTTAIKFSEQQFVVLQVIRWSLFVWSDLWQLAKLLHIAHLNTLSSII